MNIERLLSIGLAAALSAGMVIAPTAFGAAEPAGAAIAGLTSRKNNGVVTVVSDPKLAEGRLVLKVVAFNQAATPAAFSDANVRVFTAAGKAVGLVPLDRLIDEAKTAANSQRRLSSSHDPSSYSHPAMHTAGVGGAGEPDVTGYTGANNPTSGVMSPHTRATTATPEEIEQQLQEQIASLKAGVLQPLTIAPSSAAGGQIVTEKLKFSRKEERALRVVVDLNGEQHEFSFAAPPPK